MTPLHVILTVLLVRIPVLPPAQRFYYSDLADRSVKFWTFPTIARRAVLGRDAKNGTDAKFLSVFILHSLHVMPGLIRYGRESKEHKEDNIH